ncbi:sugar transferase [Clostridium sp. AF15-17LB]|nr:sugar transferase [Clostridium sp. AF15-17LB]
MIKWEELPPFMQVDEVKDYYDIISCHKVSLLLKRIFDVIAAGILLAVLSPLLLIISILIKLDSRGPVMFRQVRVTSYGRHFKIFKFRTMVQDADKKGTQVTTKGDARVTKVGHVLRKYRLDELPQLLNVLLGDMSFVGTRPEVVKYVEHYSNEMLATLLMPAGITSLTSIVYKDEEKLLESVDDADKTYIEQILPEKMKYNLMALKEFSFVQDIKTMFRTVSAVINS